MVYYQMLVTVQLQIYYTFNWYKFQQSQYKEVQKVVKFIKLKFIKMTNKLDPKDLAYVQNLIRLNADVNGSLNILKKVVGNFDYDPIEVCSTPSVYTVKFN